MPDKKDTKVDFSKFPDDIQEITPKNHNPCNLESCVHEGTSEDFCQPFTPGCTHFKPMFDKVNVTFTQCFTWQCPSCGISVTSEAIKTECCDDGGSYCNAPEIVVCSNPDCLKEFISVDPVLDALDDDPSCTHYKLDD